jgi:hypothetical protein
MIYQNTRLISTTHASVGYGREKTHSVGLPAA